MALPLSIALRVDGVAQARSRHRVLHPPVPQGHGRYEHCSEAWTVRRSTGGGDSFQ